MKNVFSSTTAILLLGLLIWPIAYSLWISFSPSNALLPPTSDWSLRWYREFFERPEWTGALVNSVKIAVLSGLISIALGVSGAMAARDESTVFSKLISSVILIPLFIPAIILGLALLPAMRFIGLWGSLTSIALAHSLWGAPLVFLAARSALAGMDASLPQAAAGLGANSRQVFWFITLPQLKPAILTGALMAFIVSFNELVMALFLSTPATETLPKIIWPNLRYTLSPLVASASGISMLVTIIPLAAAWIFLNKKQPIK